MSDSLPISLICSSVEKTITNKIYICLGDSGIGFLLVRIAAGITTGTLAIFSAQPTDVVKVRMQAEVKKQGEKSQYKGVIDAYRTIARTEGMKGLYKGINNHLSVSVNDD